MINIKMIKKIKYIIIKLNINLKEYKLKKEQI